MADFHPPEFNTTSPEYAVPILMDLIKPRSVIDFGCNIGAWLKEFMERGCDIFGVDEASHMSKHLLIPESKFDVADLRHPVRLLYKADLVLCLETAEHLAPEFADTLIETLCVHTNRHIAFSAAKPGQGGYNHLNEQPMEYWLEKFESSGWRPIKQEVVWPDEVFDYHQRMVILSCIGVEKHD